MKFFVMAVYGISGGLFSKLFSILYQSKKINKWYIISIGLIINIFVYIANYAKELCNLVVKIKIIVILEKMKFDWNNNI